MYVSQLVPLPQHSVILGSLLCSFISISLLTNKSSSRGFVFLIHLPFNLILYLFNEDCRQPFTFTFCHRMCRLAGESCCSSKETREHATLHGFNPVLVKSNQRLGNICTCMQYLADRSRTGHSVIAI
jgi:hypothetical protein